MPARAHAITEKVATPFGSMYVHVEYDDAGRLCGGSISDPQKEPDAQIAELVQALSAGLDDALAAHPLHAGAQRQGDHS